MNSNTNTTPRIRTGTTVISRQTIAKNRSKGAKLWHDASVIRKLYEQDGRTQSQIAKELGCSLMTISKAFKKHGIKAIRGRRPSKIASSRIAKPVLNARIAKGAISPAGVQEQIIELTEIMDRLGPHARAAVKKDLHELIDRL